MTDRAAESERGESAAAPVPESDSAPLWQIFTAFARVGLFTFGGGYAMLPLIQREVVEKKGWATEAQILDYYAIGQCTPGVIAVNTATFVGYRLRGVLGGIVATLGVIAPSIAIITAIAAFLKNFADYPIVGHAFGGIRVAVTALIIQAIVKLWKNSIADALSVFLFGLAFAAVAFLKASPIWVVIAAALIGIAANSLRNAKAAAAPPSDSSSSQDDGETNRGDAS